MTFVLPLIKLRKTRIFDVFVCKWSGVLPVSLILGSLHSCWKTDYFPTECCQTDMYLCVCIYAYLSLIFGRK